MLSVLRRTRKSLTAVALILSALVISACAAGGPGPGGGRLGETVNVALLVPSGSGQAADDVLALGLENAARLAMADLGGEGIILTVYPTAGRPDQAAAMAAQAVAGGAQIILGPVYAQEAKAAGAAVAGSGVNLLAFSNNTDVAGNNVFVLGPTFQNTARRLLVHAYAQGLSRIMIVHDQTPAGEVGRQAIARGAALAGASVVATGSYEFSQNGVVSAIQGLVASARDTGAQAVFLTADTAGALPLVSQLLSEGGLDPATTRYIGLTRWDIPEATLSFPGLQGGWFALPDPVLFAQFEARYEAAYGQAPHPIAGLGYDGIAAIGALMQAGGEGGLSVGALTQAAGFAGVSGMFRLLPDGTNERALAVAEVQNAAPVIVSPAPRAFSRAGF
ncbi:MAG: penicillin-binding protein activator [Paracoccaceae bacterium]